MKSDLEELKRKEQEIFKKLETKRLAIGEADSPMVSRYPTGRFDLESDIAVLETQLNLIRTEIKKLEVNE